MNLEIGIKPIYIDVWKSGTKYLRRNSLSVLAVAGLLSGGCCDAGRVANNFENGNFDHATTRVAYLTSEFVLSAGILKYLELPKKEKLIFEGPKQIGDGPTELQDSQPLDIQQ